MLSVTETETLAAYMKPPSRYGGAGGAGGADDSSGGPAKGFVVRDAPWNAGNKVGHADFYMLLTHVLGIVVILQLLFTTESVKKEEMQMS